MSALFHEVELNWAHHAGFSGGTEEESPSPDTPDPEGPVRLESFLTSLMWGE